MIRVLCVLLLASLASCVSSPGLYGWGSYEQLVYASYVAPGSLSPATQIQKLEEDYQKFRATNQRVPPGWHAHLGYLYAQTGKPDAAQRELLAEKAAFPESTVMVNSLLINLRRQ